VTSFLCAGPLTVRACLFSIAASAAPPTAVKTAKRCRGLRPLAQLHGAAGRAGVQSLHAADALHDVVSERQPGHALARHLAPEISQRRLPQLPLAGRLEQLDHVA
jgi:hypothetical protein